MLCSFLIYVVTLTYILFFLDPTFENASIGALLLVSTFGYDEIMYALFTNMGAFENELVSIEHCETFMDLPPERGYVDYLRHRE